MTQYRSDQLRRAALAASAIFMAVAAVTTAFAEPEPWRAPTDAPAPTPHATSSAAAFAPTPAEQHETRALATAVFAKPAAAARAADKVEAANATAIPPADPKPEWLSDEGLHFGGKGLEVKSPF